MGERDGGAVEIPAGGYPALEGQSVRSEPQLTEAAGLPAISLAEARAIRDLILGLAYPNKYQIKLLGICADIIVSCAKAKSNEICAMLAARTQGSE